MDRHRLRAKYRRSITLMTAILSSVLLMAGAALLYLTVDLKSLWSDYNEQIQRRNVLLADLNRAVGYGGFIHNFKNYVLRGDRSRSELLQQDMKQLDRTLDQYFALQLNSEEFSALTQIKATFERYRRMIAVVDNGVALSDSAEVIDLRVKVDDSQAQQALQTLHKYNQGLSRRLDKLLDEQIQLLFNSLLLGLFVMPFILLGAYHYRGVLDQIVDLRVQNKQVARALQDTTAEMTAAHKKRLEMEHQAFHCDLTKVANRKAFNQHGQLLLDQAEQSGEKVSVLFVDVDDFKQINDQHGHEIGDKVLVEVATRLSLALREEDLVARVGGDEFALIVRSKGELQHAQTLGERLLEVMNESYMFLAEGLDVSCSVGGAIYPDEGGSLEELMKVADRRMYYVKRSGKNGIFLEEPDAV